MDVPRQLGPYRLLRRLGHGGMAEVFVARAYGASGFEKTVAVKTLLPELRGEPELERLLIEEARMGARLTHRNLVAVHDLGTADGIYYVCMDYVDGLDLATLHAARPLPIDLVLHVGEEILFGLTHVHELADDAGRPLGLVHRDVSPSNVLVSRAGEVKLADFGIAKATRLAETTQASIRRGKYAYMSPEQVAGLPLTAESDQFGFGIVCFELLAGRRPFDGPSPVETMDRIREATPPDASTLPEAVRTIVLRCLARDPRDRFPSTRALGRALAALHTTSTHDAIDALAACVADATRQTAAPVGTPPTRPMDGSA